MRVSTRVLVALSAVLVSAAAQATTTLGGNTRLRLSSTTEGLTAGLVGSATLAVGQPGLTINFPITGGTFDTNTLVGTIRHDGSGLSLSNGTNLLTLSNFVIDTSASLVFGDAALNGTSLGTGLDLFSFDLSTVTVPQLIDLNNPLLELLITSTTSGALTAAFGLDDDDVIGVSVGSAATAPVAGIIPEPESWLLLLTGFAITGIALRRRPARAVAV
jgi:hypothetical protein